MTNHPHPHLKSWHFVSAFRGPGRPKKHKPMCHWSTNIMQISFATSDPSCLHWTCMHDSNCRCFFQNKSGKHKKKNVGLLASATVLAMSRSVQKLQLQKAQINTQTWSNGFERSTSWFINNMQTQGKIKWNHQQPIQQAGLPRFLGITFSSFRVLLHARCPNTHLKNISFRKDCTTSSLRPLDYTWTNTRQTNHSEPSL